MTRLLVRSFGVSLDGFAAGPDQSLEHPLGVRGPELMDWFFPTRVWQQMQKTGEANGETRWFEILERLRELMMREKKLYPNVEYYSGSAYYQMGVPLDLFTPIFAVSRISGWTAHILEQYANNRLIRPRAEYTGARGVPYVPIDER